MRHQTFENRPSETVRQAIHDLRNLFGIVSSAGHLLGEAVKSQRDLRLLDAVEQAAIRGRDLTTVLLAASVSPLVAQTYDLNVRIASLAPMIQALAGAGTQTLFDLRDGRLPVRADPMAFDAAILELVRNASCALAPGGRLVIRSHRVGKRIWVSVADDGAGMSPMALRNCLTVGRPAAAHGTGVHRVAHFAGDTRGSMHIRSIPQRGTVVALNLPMALNLTFDELAAPVWQSPPMEIHHENRQPVAA